MRVTYNRQMQVKEFLDKTQVENYLPMVEKVFRRDGKIKHKQVPAVSNLIFIHDSQARITEMKQTQPDAFPLRYMMRPVGTDKDAHYEIIIVGDREMHNFMRAANVDSQDSIFIPIDKLHGHEQGRVLITGGPFKGVEGVVRRVKGSRHVVVELEGVGGLCINFVPKSFILKQDRETEKADSK